jgi:hypothetical protein
MLFIAGIATPWTRMFVISEKGVERISITEDAGLSNQKKLVVAGKVGMGSQWCEHMSA